MPWDREHTETAHFQEWRQHVDPAWSVEQTYSLASMVEGHLIAHFEAVEDVVVPIEPEGH